MPTSTALQPDTAPSPPLTLPSAPPPADVPPQGITPADPPTLPPLDLDLHRRPVDRPTVQQQAVHDDRSNAHPRTFESRLGHDLDDRETTERLADGSIRHRQGAECMIEHPARTSQLFPMDETSRRAPPAWGPCP